MNYPFWLIPGVGGGLLIAIIAIVHAYIAHLAVGGGLFLVVTERKARRENDERLLGFVKQHSRFFLLLTVVFGAVTGVGIWFIISLVHPAGTSSLIHNFVFGWAIEWTFFIGEIVAILVYYYFWDRMKPGPHMAMGWLYFIFAWLSLVVINGILAFMLTPGKWLETGNFWHGFFNPTYFSTLVLRTGMALSIAGLFGLITATFIGDRDLRTKVVRYCARWLLVPFAVTIVGALWYMNVAPREALDNVLLRNPEAIPYGQVAFWGTVVLFAGGLVTLIRWPRGLQRLVAFALVLIGLFWFGGFEYMREIARKPYVIHGYMYSNSITRDQVETLSRDGFLAHAKWARVKQVTPENRLAAGEELFTHQCLICHTLGGQNDIRAYTEKFDYFGLQVQLAGQGKINTYMPPFFGTPEERDALAAYITEGLHGKTYRERPDYEIAQEPVDVPPFDAERDEYVLLAWNDLGMHCISDSDPWWVLLPPANSIWAQVVKRGEWPEIVTAGVRLEYEVEPGYEHPEKHVRFWEFAPQNFGADLTPPVGLAGKALQGELEPKPEQRAYAAELIPVVPYRDDNTYNPYPIFTVRAYLEGREEPVATTRIVAPTSTEMGCKHCHGGPWRKFDRAGISDEAARDVLAVHDRMSRTRLLEAAERGEPRLCQSCHPDPVLGAEGNPRLLNLPAAIHGFHANYLPDMGAEACLNCHPSRASGPTGCLRGRHGVAGLTCVECHGPLEDHALSLLKHEHEAGKAGAARLMANLEPQTVASVEEINARLPWHNECDCLGCHADYQLMDINGFNKWTPGAADLYRNRADSRGVMCAACHGSPHAVYPAENRYGADRDNIPPLQYQQIAGTIATERNCTVCHTKVMEVSRHHPNMLR